MTPILKEFTTIQGVPGKILLVTTETGKRREVMGSLDHIHRVDLKHTDGAKHLPEMPDVDSATGPRRVEALSPKGDAPGPLQGDLSHSPVK